jgi:hypothetical protein
MKTETQLLTLLNLKPTSSELVQIDDPEWQCALGAGFDWRSHIPEPLRRFWPSLKRESRVVAFILAQQARETSGRFIE